MNQRILTDLCSVPTAPFAEQYVVAWVEEFVRRRPKLKLTRDEYGNLLIELPSRSRQPRWVFGAHMDHPGFVAEKMLDERTVEATFRGWVHIDYVRGTKVRFFPATGKGGWGEVAGKVIEASSDQYDRLTVPNRVKVRLTRALPEGTTIAAGTPGMFDQGEGRVQGKRFLSRVCDDLAGAAAALSMIDALARSKKAPEAPIAVLLTRAEEEGFIGAIAAAVKPKLLRKSDNLIAIETSAMQPYAQQGNGAIIRIGDKTSVFNSDLSYFITAKAEELAKKKGLKFQRALMPGGTCEATVYDIYGFRAAAVCVALGNYHNMDKERKRIGPEYVDLEDWQAMAELFVHLARHGHEYEPGHKLLKKRVEARFERLKHLL